MNHREAITMLQRSGLGSETEGEFYSLYLEEIEEGHSQSHALDCLETMIKDEKEEQEEIRT